MHETRKQSPEAQALILVLNQVFEIEQKLGKLKETTTIGRNISKIRNVFEETFKMIYHDPKDERFSLTRTDCEGNIAGALSDELIITEVFKPIVKFKSEGLSRVIQKAVVVAQAKIE